jgi:hypothetical protein
LAFPKNQSVDITESLLEMIKSNWNPVMMCWFPVSASSVSEDKKERKPGHGIRVVTPLVSRYIIAKYKVLEGTFRDVQEYRCWWIGWNSEKGWVVTFNLMFGRV